MTQVSTAQKGRTFIRAQIAKACTKSGNPEVIANFATGRWGAYQAAEISKAAVSPIGSESLVNGGNSEFLQLVLQRSLLQKISSLREVPFQVRLITMAQGARGYFVGQGKPLPLSSASISGSVLPPLKVQSAIVATKESLEDVKAERVLQRDFERALALAVDDAFAGSSAGVEGEIPAGLGYGATQILASGSTAAAFRADLAAAFEAYSGDVESAVLMLNPRTALNLAMLQQPLGSATFGVRGGELFDIAVVTSAGVPFDSSGANIILADASAIAFGASELKLDVAHHADLQMSDAPDSASADGTVMISLWQNNLICFKATLWANWEVQRPGSVVQITGANYGD